MWNFEYLDTLTPTPLRHARLFTARRMKDVSLLFVHGGFHGAWCWADSLKFFDDSNIGCAAIDLRGHGGLKQLDDFARQGIAEMAEDVREAVAAMGGDVVVVGHSAGALTSLVAAQSIQMRGLVLITPAAPANVTLKRIPLPAFAADQVIAVPNEERIRKWFMQGIEGNVDLTPVIGRLCRESPAFMNDCFARGTAIDPTSITCPTLCLSGGRDHSPLHARGQDRAVAEFLHAGLENIPVAGHCLMIEPLWRTGAVAILSWLRRTGIVAV